MCEIRVNRERKGKLHLIIPQIFSQYLLCTRHCLARERERRKKEQGGGGEVLALIELTWTVC